MLRFLVHQSVLKARKLRGDISQKCTKTEKSWLYSDCPHDGHSSSGMIRIVFAYQTDHHANDATRGLSSPILQNEALKMPMILSLSMQCVCLTK